MTELVIEQDAKLNPHVIDMRPISWRQRWERAYFGRIFAVIVLWYSLFQFLGLWIDDKVVRPEYLLNGFVLLPLLFCGIPIIWNEWMVRSERASMRRMTMGDKYLLLSPDGIVLWERIEGWHLARLAGDPSVQKLTVLYHPDAKSTYAKHWSVILVEPELADRLLSLLAERRRAGKLGAKLLSDLPLARDPHKPSVTGLLLSMTGATICVFAGMGLFGAALFLERDSIPFGPGLLRIEHGNFNDLVVSVLTHFHGSHELGWCMVTVGLVGLLIGFPMLRCGNRLLSRPPSG